MSSENGAGLPPEIFEKLLGEYRKSLPERLKSIRSAIDSLRKEASPENLATFRFLVHKMAGNAGTFGYGKVTELCKKWELRVVEMGEKCPSCAIDNQFFIELEDFFKAIQKEFGVYGG